MPRNTRITKYALRPLLAVMMGMTLLGLAPTTASAVTTNPVDLQLGGTGATPWSITNIKPADSGTQSVELRNVGSQDGFVSIWLSDIISSEGLNPESETGNTLEPGELDDYLLLSLNATGLTSNFNLPATVRNLPQSANGTRYINIIPVKTGSSVNLEWSWNLPAGTPNAVQGDEISFTLNYLLRECRITSVASSVTANGTFTKNVTAQSDSNQGNLTINQGVTGKTKEGLPLSEIWIVEMEQPATAPPPGKVIIGQPYENGPDGATFDQPITLTLNYDRASLPSGASETDLVIALWDRNTARWLPLPGSTVNTAAATVSAPITHFSRYTILATAPPPPIEEEPPLPPPVEVAKKEQVKVLETIILGSESTTRTSDDGSLLQQLRLSDPSGSFIIDFGAGSRITAVDGTPVTRLEITRSGEVPVTAGDIAILSPAYRITGYINNREIPLTVFQPAATVTISYETSKLPENILPPFVAEYSDGQLIKLPPTPGSTIELGRATALIDHSSLFFVAAEIIPPPPPLPAMFEAYNLTINPRQALAGETVTVSVSITNRGETAGTYEVHLIVDGIVRAIEEVTLTPKSSQSITFEVANLAAGEHTIKVAGLTGDFEVTSLPVTIEEPTVDWFIIDISVIGALVIGALVLYLMTRQPEQS